MYRMFKSRTSLVYTFWVEDIFEFYPSLFIPAMYNVPMYIVHGSYRLYEDKYIPWYVHGMSLGSRVPEKPFSSENMMLQAS